jgi:hypothetical protein
MNDRIKAQLYPAGTTRTGPMSNSTCSTLNMVCLVSDRLIGLCFYDDCMYAEPRKRTGRCKSTCVNSMQTGIMPCATFRHVPFQYSSSHSFEKYQIGTLNVLLFPKSHSNAKCFSTEWQHDHGGAWLKECFSESCSRCLVLIPLPFPTLPK